MRTVLALALLVPAAALDRCPVSDDISAGIVYARGTPGNEAMDVAFGTTSYLTSYYELGEFGMTRQVVMLKGVYPVSLTDIVTERVRTVSYHYAASQAEFPEPAPGVNWRVEARVTQGDGTRRETQVYTFGREEEREIGDCSYGVIPYEIATRSGDAAPRRQDMFYIPVLGVGFPEPAPQAQAVQGDESEAGQEAHASERMTTYPDQLAEWGN